MEFGTGCQLEEGHAPDFADGGGNVSDAVLLLGQRQWPYLTVTTSALGLDLLSGGSSVFTLRAFGQLDGVLDLLSGGSSVFSLRAFGQLDGVPERRVNPLPIRNCYPNGQVWVFRPDPQSASTAFAVGVKGGHNAEFHNHNDVGSYAIRFGGVLISGDPGGTEYTAITFSPKRYTIPIISSYGHPVPHGDYVQPEALHDSDHLVLRPSRAGAQRLLSGEGAGACGAHPLHLVLE